jgi:cob(I)alamin adenosyltransferase
VSRRTKTPITTRKGDSGHTHLWSGERVSKYDLRVEAGGSIDEAAAVLGQARTGTRHEEVRAQLLQLQNDLFLVMSELSWTKDEGRQLRVGEELVADAEDRIAMVRDQCDLPASFVIAATPNSATLDVARTVIRRAERTVTRMVHEGVIDNPNLLKYLNRASDLAFLLARWEEKLDGVPYHTISAADVE